MSLWLELHQEAGSGWKIIVAPRRRADIEQDITGRPSANVPPSLFYNITPILPAALFSYLGSRRGKKTSEKDGTKERSGGTRGTHAGGGDA